MDTNKQESTAEEIRMQWFLLYFTASLSVAIIATDLAIFFITRNYWTLIPLSLPIGLMRPMVRHLFPGRADKSQSTASTSLRERIQHKIKST